MTRVGVCDGWAAYVDGSEQVPGGTVVDVPDDTAAWWIGRGWVVPAPAEVKPAREASPAAAEDRSERRQRHALVAAHRDRIKGNEGPRVAPFLLRGPHRPTCAALRALPPRPAGLPRAAAPTVTQSQPLACPSLRGAR